MIQSINISWTELQFLRSTLFQNLPNLTILDLRWNKLNQMAIALILPNKFEQLYLDGKKRYKFHEIK